MKTISPTQGFLNKWLSHNEQGISVFLLNRMYWTHISHNSLATFYECQLSIVTNLLPVVPAFEDKSHCLRNDHYESDSIEVNQSFFSVVKVENSIKKSMLSVSMNWLSMSKESFFYYQWNLCPRLFLLLSMNRYLSLLDLDRSITLCFALLHRNTTLLPYYKSINILHIR